MSNFYNGQHAHYCGIDLHKKTMYVYVINHDGETVFHKNIRTRPDEFLRAVAPYREDLVPSNVDADLIRMAGRPRGIR